MGTLLVAGASGALGSSVARLARANGWTVRAMVRDAHRAPDGCEVAIADARDAAAVARAAEGVDVVFSCVGASVMPQLGRGWRGYGAVDWPCNKTLIDATRTRFVYVSVHHTPAMRRLAYVDAHERVVEHLRAAARPFAVVRPTGFFSAISMFVDMAKKGPLPEIAGGVARTNPIGDDDLAAVCLEAIESSDPALELDCGGPEILTRREMNEAAFAAIGRPTRVRRLPAGAIRLATWLGRPFHPRITQFLRFVADISTHDLIAPQRGRQRLAEAFAARARA